MYEAFDKKECYKRAKSCSNSCQKNQVARSSIYDFFNTMIEGVVCHINFLYMIFYQISCKVFFSEPEILKSFVQKQKINYDFPAMLTKSILIHS